MKPKPKSKQIISRRALLKITAKYPDLFRFRKDGALDPCTDTPDIFDALFVKMTAAKCSCAEFAAHLETLRQLAAGALNALHFLNSSQNLPPNRVFLVFDTLLSSASNAVSEVELIARRSVEAFKSAKIKNSINSKIAIPLVEYVAGQKTSWPVMLPRKYKLAKEQWHFVIEKLGLGKLQPFNIEGKRSNPLIANADEKERTILSPGWTAAVSISELIIGYRSNRKPANFHAHATDQLLSEARKLRPPSKSSKEDWWKVGRQILVNVWGIEFWKNEYFASFRDKKAGLSRYTSLEKSGPLKVRVEKSVKSCFFSSLKHFQN